MTTKTLPTICGGCGVHCSLEVRVENGRATAISAGADSPAARTCPRVRAALEWAYSKDRVLNPRKRMKIGWEEISWDAALGEIAERLGTIKTAHGAEAMLAHIGVPFVNTDTGRILRRFCDAYGTPNYSSGASYCSLAAVMGFRLTLGKGVAPDSSPATKCRVIWGCNPPESDFSQRDLASAGKEQGARLVVVDPRRTALARQADIHAQLRPGTDCALALGLLNVIIGERLYDAAFVEKWTVGFDRLAEHVTAFTPEAVARISGVPAATVRDLARTYAAARPAYIDVGISAQHSTNGIQTVRALACLMAITGNVDAEGGNVFSPPFSRNSLRLGGRVADAMAVDAKALGSRYPLFAWTVHEDTASPWTEAILTGVPYQPKALLVQGCNALQTWPNSNKVREAFKKLDLLVVVDIFMTETARAADFVLPGTTFLERGDLRSRSDQTNNAFLAALSEAVIPPLGNSMEDWMIWARLGERMGYGEVFPWKTSNELFAYSLQGKGLTVEQLQKSPAGVRLGEPKAGTYHDKGFSTPSKKVELYSQAMLDQGYDPLPTFHEPAESPASRPELAAAYPLVLTSGARFRSFIHSQHRNVASLLKMMPEPRAEINATTAKKLGISDGARVWVETQRGRIQLKAKTTTDILPDVVCIPHGWEAANANALTDDEARDPVSGYPGFRSLLCRVTKAD